MKKNIKGMLFNMGHIESVSRCQNGLTVILRHLCRKKSNIHVEQSETSHGMFASFKKLIAFSLVELMISLITISCIAAAFTPVITKKLKKQDVALSLAQTSEISDVCGKDSGKNFGNDTDGYNCKLCTKAYCVQCGLTNCGEGKYIDTKSCTCKRCKEDAGLNNCLACKIENSEAVCIKCQEGDGNKGTGYYLQKKDDNNNPIGTPEKTCQPCGNNKYCEDGIYEASKSVCADPPGGYFCLNNKLTHCSIRFGRSCSTCDNTACKTCSGGTYMANGECKGCTSGCNTCDNPDTCISCGGGHLINPQNKCQACSSIIANCFYCSGTTSNATCTKCSGGYYRTNSNKTCTPCSNISNCFYCSDDGKCTKCNAGYYVNSSGTCVTCSVDNCAQCDKDGKCGACNKGYYIKKGKCEPNNSEFNCSEASFMKIGKLCVTRRNMGDSRVLTIPNTVRVADGGDICPTATDKCCWKGNTSTSCNADYGEYSGCDRTVCNYQAANEICEKFDYAGLKWRLPTADEVAMFAQYSVGLGSNGLMICTHSTNQLSNYCTDSSNCKGSNWSCFPRDFWSGTPCSSESHYGYTFKSGIMERQCDQHPNALSPRCVAEMNE